MMKGLVFLAFLAQTGAALAQTGAATPLPATDIKASDIEAAIERAISTGRDASVRVIDDGNQHIGITMVQQPTPGPSGGGTHETVTEVYHVLKGSATLVTGGISGPRRSDGGFRIQGGVSRQVSAGDVIIIPAGTPHGLSEIHEDITIIVVRVDSGSVIELQ